MKSFWSMMVRWSPAGRILGFLGSIACLWLPIALPLYWASDQGKLPGGDTVPTALLYVFFLALVPQWSRQVHRLSEPFQQFGLVPQRGTVLDGIQGYGLGVLGITALVSIELALGWMIAQPLPSKFWIIVVEGAMVGLLVGLAEELLFRGWLLYELEQGFSPSTALWSNALVFAIAHFIKPLGEIWVNLPQFFGLLLLGLTLVWARRTPSHGGLPRRTTTLGYAIGLHGGLVTGYYWVAVGELLQPSGTVGSWMTGIDDNPLAGMLGLGLMAGLASVFYYSSHR